MRLHALVTAVALAATLACGTDDDRAPAAPPPGGDGDAVPGGGGTGNGDTGGGAGDGGTGAGTIASPDGTVVVEPLDTSAECAGLLPSSAPSAASLRIADAEQEACGPGTSEGGGHVAVATRVSPIGPGPGRPGRVVQWQVFAPDGTPRQRIDSHFPPGTDGLRPRWGLFPQPDGWQSARAIPPNTVLFFDEVSVLTFSGDGSPRRSERASPPSGRDTWRWGIAEDPLGGVMVFHSGPEAVGLCSGTVNRYDEAGVPRGAAGAFGVGGDCIPLAGAVSGRGAALLVEAHAGTAWLHWIGADGTPARPRSSHGDVRGPNGLFRGAGAVFLAPLLDGSIVASEGGAWTRHFPYLGDRAGDAPGWLASRPGFTFRNTRGARGYALFPPDRTASADCSQRVEILAPSGRRCGAVILKGDGGACATGAADQGWDGTVVQQGARDRCSWRFWPRLLAGE